MCFFWSGFVAPAPVEIDLKVLRPSRSDIQNKGEKSEAQKLDKKKHFILKYILVSFDFIKCQKVTFGSNLLLYIFKNFFQFLH